MKNIVNGFKNIIGKINKVNESYSKWSEKKPQNILLQFFPRNLFLLIFSIVIVCLLVPKVTNNYMISYVTNNFTGYDKPIVTKSVKQKMKIVKTKEIKKLGIVFGTYKRVNNSTYKLEIIEDNDKVIYSKNFNAKKLPDNKLKYFKVNRKIDPKKEYKFIVTPIKVKDENHAITVAMNKKEIYYSITRHSSFYNEVLVACFIFLIIFFIINYLINNNKIKSERKFLLLMLTYIIPILFIYPAFDIPDEIFHFNKSMRLSQYDITNTPAYTMTEKKVKAPKNLNCLYYSEIKAPESNNILRDEYFKCFKSTKTIYKKVAKVSPNKSLSYSIPAIGIKIADLVSNSPMVIFYSGRIINFLVAFLIIMYALKIIPKHKKIFLMVVLIPVFIQQMISYSYDSLLNALCILVTAYLIKFYNTKEKITKKELLILTISAIFILDIKEPYILLFFPLLLLDKKKFGKEKYDKLKSLMIMGGTALITCFIIKYLNNIGVKAGEGATNTIASVLFHPRHLLKIIYNTINYNTSFYLESMIGSFGWLSKKLDLFIVYNYLIFMGFVTAADESKLTLKTKIINILLILILLAGGVFFAMYLLWTPTGNEIVEGVQGRYFLAVLLLFLIMLVPKKRKLKIKSETIYQFLNISMISYIITILVAFY